MKPTTEQIKSLLANLDYLQKSMIENLSDNRIAGIAHQEVSLKEALENFQHLRELCLDIIEKNSNLFEKVIIQTNRATIIALLAKIHQLGNQIKTNITNIAVLQQSGVQLIANITSVQQIINSVNLESYIKGAPNYHKKLSQISYLHKRFKEIEAEMEQMNSYYKNIYEINESSNIIRNNLQGLFENVGKLSVQIEAVNKDIDQRYQAIKILNQNILDYDANSKQNTDSINKFFNEIEKFRAVISENLKKIKDQLSFFDNLNKEKLKENEKLYKESIKIADEKSQELIEQNAKLQQDIIGILGKSIGTQLYKAFEEKAKSLKIISWIWLGFLIISLVGLTIIGYDVVHELITASTPFSTSFYLRITVLFPILYGVYFFSTLFKTANKIKEEYDFKSAVSVSLSHFKDVIENSKNCAVTQSFLKESVYSIFSSPTDRAFNHQKPDKDLNDRVEGTVDKLLTLVNSMTKK